MLCQKIGYSAKHMLVKSVIQVTLKISTVGFTLPILSHWIGLPLKKWMIHHGDCFVTPQLICRELHPAKFWDVGCHSDSFPLKLSHSDLFNWSWLSCLGYWFLTFFLFKPSWYNIRVTVGYSLSRFNIFISILKLQSQSQKACFKIFTFKKIFKT